MQWSGTACLVDCSARVHLISDSPDRLDTNVFYCFSCHHRNNSSVGSTEIRLWGGQSGVRIPVGPGDFSLFQKVQTGSGFYIQRIFSQGIKRPGRKDNHSPPFSAEVKNKRNYTSTPPYAFMVWAGKILSLHFAFRQMFVVSKKFKEKGKICRT